jgi:hypothetical protein
MLTTDQLVIGIAQLSLDIVATILLGIVCRKRRDLIWWFYAYCFLTFGVFVSLIFAIPDSPDMISPIFYIVAIAILSYAVVKEYLETFSKMHNQGKSLIKAKASIFAITPLMLGLEISIIVIVLINVCLIFRIFLKKRTPTHAFLFLSLIGTFLSVFSGLFKDFGIEGAVGFQNVANIIYPTLLVMTGIVALIELKLMQSNTALRVIIDSASEASINTSNIATELAASASEVNASSEEISSTIQTMNRESQDVMASTNELRNIFNLIKNIAEQTNLLALNASIEAGRAGEYGRGFAVVADEVRKLAEESKTAVIDTSQKIDVIIRKIQTTTSSMEGISASTEEQSASIEEITATANRLGNLAENLKEKLISK